MVGARYRAAVKKLLTECTRINQYFRRRARVGEKYEILVEVREMRSVLLVSKIFFEFRVVDPKLVFVDLLNNFFVGEVSNNERENLLQLN